MANTPKEKAEELVKLFKFTNDGDRFKNDKDCALICANELQLYAGGMVCAINGKKVLMYDYFEEVKNEIEKL